MYHTFKISYMDAVELCNIQDGRIAWRQDDEVKMEGTSKTWQQKSQKALTDNAQAKACGKFLLQTVEQNYIST